MELVKNALCTIIQRTYRVERLHAYFSRINGEEMEFAIFLPRKPEPVYHSNDVDGSIKAEVTVSVHREC